MDSIPTQGTKSPTCHRAPAAAPKSLQSCPTLCDPIYASSPGSPVPGILQAWTLEWAAISFSNAWKWKVKVKLLSCVRLLATPWTAAYQAPLSMGFSRQEYWSGVPSPSPDSLLRYRNYVKVYSFSHLAKGKVLPKEKSYSCLCLFSLSASSLTLLKGWSFRMQGRVVKTTYALIDFLMCSIYMSWIIITWM